MAISHVLLMKVLWGNTKGKKGKGFVQVTQLHQQHGVKTFFMPNAALSGNKSRARARATASIQLDKESPPGNTAHTKSLDKSVPILKAELSDSINKIL